MKVRQGHPQHPRDKRSV